MVDGLEKRLAEASTDDEAKAALLAAARKAWPDDEGHNARYVMRSRALAILNGPSAGWIGVGVLMVPAGATFKLQVFDNRCEAAVFPFDGGAFDGINRWKRPDCALVLASLRALKSKDHQHG